VAGNALLALYRLGEASAIAGLHEMASRPDPSFRTTAVWAMSETGDTRFLPHLGKLLTDPNATIKAAVFRAIRRLRAVESAPTRPLEVRILGKPTLEESTLNIAFGISDGSKPVPGILATKVRILLDGELVHRYTVTEQESRRRVSAAFLVPRIADQRRERSLAYCGALEGCFEHRRRGDGWLLSQYSGSLAADRPVRPETLFGVRVDPREMSQVYPVETLAGLRNAIETARSLEFTAAFLGLCERLRPSTGTAHVFLFRPQGAPALESAILIQAAQDAHVSVHAICDLPDQAVHRICQSTGGFYAVSENVGKTLAGFYRGVSHRYLASLAPDARPRQVRIAVRTEEFAGESPLFEIIG
jgi:hypothetical protein